MKGTRKVYLIPEVHATLTLSLTISPDQEKKADLHGMSKVELQNAMGQKMEELLELLGNTDEV